MWKQLWKIWLPLFLLLGFAFLLRTMCVARWLSDLNTDPDAYWSIARQLQEGHGYSNGGGNPTAFRPPLYPMLLWGVLGPNDGMPRGDLLLGLVHILLGTATVFLTWKLGRLVSSPVVGWLAAALVAVDPLLLRNTALPMTETLCASLVTLWLWWWLRYQLREQPPKRWEEFVTGVLFGLCVLSRPTFWAFVGLYGAYLGLCMLRERRLLIPWWVMLGTCLVVSPWLGRNLLAFQKPIFTTTHGGYTLLVGNNPVFYREVVNQPLGTVWEAESLLPWQAELEREQRAAGIDATDEVARDAWCYQRATENIQAQPGMFFKACGLRLIRFWNIAPAGGQNTQNSTLTLLVGLFYLAVTIGLIAGIWVVLRTQPARFLPLLLLLLSFSVVHTVYWSNMRMRAPLVPVIAVLAAVGGLALLRRFLKKDRPDSPPAVPPADG